MRYYQMEATAVAEQLNCDLDNGCSAENSAERSGIIQRILRSVRGIIRLHRSKFYYVDVIVVICYAISVIFSCLNHSWAFLNLTVTSLIITTLLYLAEGYLLYHYSETYYNRLSANKQKVLVIRNGQKISISNDELVIGDLLCLDQGAILYADARIVSENQLFADEKFVFGATIPSEKNADPIPEKNVLPENQKNMLWKGSFISSGSGLAIVTALDSDCYVEKTGGRATKKQRSFFYNKQNNIGHIASYIYIILVAIGLLFSVIFSNHYVEAFLMMAVMTSVIMLNPVSCLMEWTYYRTASKLCKKGALIRNIEAFDGMNKEKELFFDAGELVEHNLTYSHTVDFHGSEKSSLSYFSLCMGEGDFSEITQNALKKFDLTYDQLNQAYPVFRREKDHSGNVFSVFSSNGNSVAVAAGYWQKMLPLLKNWDDSITDQIRELELHGKMVYIMTNDSMNFIPTKLDFDYFSQRMNLTALIIFDVSVAEKTLSMIGQLRRAKMQGILINDFSETFGRSIAKLYDLDDVVTAPPEKACYTLPHLKKQNLVALEDAPPIEKERAMLVLSPGIAPQQVIYRVKCMFCGIRRCLNFLAMAGVFLVLTALSLFMRGVSMEKMIIPILFFNSIMICPCYYLIESVRNCNQYRRSLILGLFCGSVGFIASLIHSDMALFAFEFSVLLLSIYLLLSGLKYRKIKKTDLILLLVTFLLVVLPWIFMGGNWVSAVILAVFPPVGAFLLDLFY